MELPIQHNTQITPTARPGAVEREHSSTEHGQDGCARSWHFKRCYSSATHIIKDTLHTFRMEPSCWIVPLVMCLLVLGLGLWGVTYSAARYAHTSRETASAAARAAAQSFERQLKQLYLPCIAISALVKEAPQLKDLRPLFNGVAPSLMAQIPSNALYSIKLSPQGIVTDSYPPDEAAMGKDVFRDPIRRAIALETVSLGHLTVAGPLPLYSGQTGLAVRLPIFLDNQTADEDYGVNQTAWECPQCYDTVTQRKFWGFATVGINWGNLMGSTSELAALTTQGYNWFLRQPNPDNPSELRDITASGASLDVAKPVVDTIDLLPYTNVSNVSPRSFTDEWFLYVSPVRGWQPVWQKAALAGIILAALAMGLLLCGVLVNRAQHIQVERDLVVSSKRLTETKKNLCEEKERLDALLARQYELLAIFDKDSLSLERKPGEQTFQERVEDVRRTMTYQVPVSPKTAGPQIQIEGLIGDGSFGKVYQGYWHGKKVAIKTLVLPADMSGTEKREAMAVMEAAISSSVSHPNIVQTYTYIVKPLAGSPTSQQGSAFVLTSASTKSYRAEGGTGRMEGAGDDIKTDRATSRAKRQTTTAPWTTLPAGVQPSVANTKQRDQLPAMHKQEDEIVTLPSTSTETDTGPVEKHGSLSFLEEPMLETGPSTVHCYEVMLVSEYCDKGNLRDAVEQGAFFTSSAFNYRAVLDTALDVARAMLHLHSVGVLHGDLKASNVLLTSNTDDPRGVVAKVGDFGLSVYMGHNNTHLSSMFTGTMTHMAPEVLLRGQVSKASDVYAFGITMYELFTGNRPFEGIPSALLGHVITADNKRPVLPIVTPPDFRALVEHCWDPEPRNRPDFEAITAELVHMRSQVGGVTPPLQFKARTRTPPPTASEWPSHVTKPSVVPPATAAPAVGARGLNKPNLGSHTSCQNGQQPAARSKRRHSVPAIAHPDNRQLFSSQVGKLHPLPEVEGEGGTTTSAACTLRHLPVSRSFG